eukprot:TRINITY_DN1447_c0_g1_i1.p2 TRINITY_DN1447_c0_g1~~TRINITY_DN1447_c0_g1_i1.p2  ORF type:complete len:190 (-),score=74.25 TRINITY_DN1447_c0_g1_i1:176-745(-)
MKVALKQRNKWDEFVELVEKGYLALRTKGEEVERAARMVFGMCLEWEGNRIEEFVRKSLGREEGASERVAREKVRYYVEESSVAWQNYFKQLSHKTIDPVWYGLLRRHFPPAVAIMAKVETSHKNQIEALKEYNINGNGNGNVNEREESKENGKDNGNGSREEKDGNQEASDVPEELRRRLYSNNNLNK